MSKFSAAAALTTALVLLAGAPASASIMSNVDSNGQFTDASVTGSFTDIFSFKLTGESEVNATFSGAPSALKISNFGIYDGAVEKTTFTQGTFGNSVAGGTSSVLLGQGTYTINVTGMVEGGGSAKYNGNLYISAVPLPPAIGLFGVSLLGLGAYGAVRKRISLRQTPSL